MNQHGTMLLVFVFLRKLSSIEGNNDVSSQDIIEIHDSCCKYKCLRVPLSDFVYKTK